MTGRGDQSRPGSLPIARYRLTRLFALTKRVDATERRAA